MQPNHNELEPYAVSPHNSLGREHAELIDPSADPFAIDRQRVLHSAAFRRLEYKTQVFVTSLDDHFRTRLTHTLEVTEIARRLCEALEVNSAVGELIALAHDLGHAPFGHAGEQALAELMAAHGGFEHNTQSLRVVEYLEHPYPAFRGLNLSYEIRESIAKHSTTYDAPGVHPLKDGKRAPLEGQIANLADRLAYECHDLEDAIGAGLINEDELGQVELWATAEAEIRRIHPALPLLAIRRPVLDKLEATLFANIVSQSQQRIAASEVASVDDVRSCRTALVGFSDEMQPLLAQLENFLRDRVYRNERLVRMDDDAKQLINPLFNAYLADPNLLPPRFASRINNQGLHRTICDYIAGMTDRFCQDEYKRILK